MVSPPSELDDLAPLLRRAGAAALQRFRNTTSRRKRDGTLVTEADLAVEEILLEGLQALFPGDGICGEEGARVAGGEGTWYLDPIDGTSSYVEGLAYWGVAIARVDAHGTALGAYYLPRLDELWFAARGRGGWRDGLPLPALEDEAPARNSVLYLPSRFHSWGRVDFPGKSRNLGSVAAHLCLVAGGSACATFIPPGWQPWDALAGLLLLEEVSGVALDLTGAPLRPTQDTSEPFVAGTPRACRALLGPGGIRARSA
jgi:fructose-1,6-bisphosphatase/inositol monophosphatase family enzyme